MSIHDTICDALQAEGYGGLEAIAEANRIIREFAASPQRKATYYVGHHAITLQKGESK